jgi:diaminopimelate epimerase
MDFTKLQGAANDFVLIEAEGIQRDWSQLALAICDRHLGVGADSLLLMLLSDKADFLMRTFDADGSEAETCGNGIRCLARYALEKGKVNRDRTEITVETAAGISRVKSETRDGRVYQFRANMGKPRFKADEIPIAPEKSVGDIVDITGMLSCKTTVKGIELTLNLVSMGNPHAVHFIKQFVKDFPLTEIGPLVENLPLFPRRVNFEIARLTGKDRIEARVWERGVGETLACGTGACAVAVAAKILGYTEREVEIELPGGVLDAEWDGEDEVVLGGPAEIVFEGNWPD